MDEVLAPVSVHAAKDGAVYDFGVNLAGSCEITVSGARGSRVILTYAEKLAPMLPQEEDTSDKPPIDPAELAEAFEAMSEMATAFDYDSLQFIFESLDGYRLPEKEAELYKEIKSAAAV